MLQSGAPSPLERYQTAVRASLVGARPRPLVGSDVVSEHETEQAEPQEDEQVEGVPVESPDESQDAEDEEAAAEEAESHDAEQEPEPEGEPQAQHEQPQALSEKDIEERNRKLDKEAMRHANRVQEIIGADMEALTPCELCLPVIPGFRGPFIPDDQRAAVMLLLGMSGVGNYAEDRHSQACGDCNGWGVVATGSKVQGQEALTCMNCNGRGWMGDRAEQVAAPLVAVLLVEQPNGVPEVVPHSPEVQQAIETARAAGAIVIEPTIPAQT